MALIVSFAAVSQAISSRRIESYRLKGDNDLDVLVRYVWNSCLCEALYPSLQTLEIALRNTLHTNIGAYYKNPLWLYDDPPMVDEWGTVAVQCATDEIVKNGKAVEPGRLVAELSFGFWTSLLDRRYERLLWPHLLRPSFPHMPAGIRNRHTLSRRFTDLRKLRNRVFHHEPIWSRPNLLHEHTEIVDTVGWICPELQTVVRLTDRFSQVHSRAFCDQLRTSLSRDGNED